MIRAWNGSVLNQLKNLYGDGSEILAQFPQLPAPISVPETRRILQERIFKLEQFAQAMEKVGKGIHLPLEGGKIFIGHGRSPVWREIKDFVSERLELPWDEFNREATPGLTTSERLSQMLEQASFAFLVMTAEDEHVNATLHARENVIHEVGLFQGRLGPRRAIVVLYIAT